MRLSLSWALTAALLLASGIASAEVIPHPAAIPLDPVGNRLTPTQEKLIEGRWCRKQTLEANTYWRYEPSVREYEYRFSKRSRSVFSVYAYADPFVMTGNTKSQGEPLRVATPAYSESFNVQITIDRDGLFVVTRYDDTLVMTDSRPPRQAKHLLRTWYRIRGNEMIFANEESYQAEWARKDGDQWEPRFARNPRQVTKDFSRAETWTRCDH
jgi:hypothetical protein